MPHLESDRERADAIVASSTHSDLFEFAPVGYLIVNCKGYICDANQTAVTLLGMEREPLLVDGSFSAFVHPDDMERWTEHTRFVITHQQRHGIDLRLRRPDNTGFFARIECSPHFDDGQKQTGKFLMVILDISARVEAEMAVCKSEMQYRALFESMDEGYCIIEVIFDENETPVDYRFLEINPAFERQTGLVDALGKSMRELAPEHEEYWFTIYGRIAVTGQPERFQKRAEQLGRWYDVYAFRFGQPEQRQVAVLFNDISEHKLAEELLKESETNLAMLAHKLEQRVQQRTAELQESEERFRTFFEESPDACFLLDLDGWFIDGNREMERQIGYTRQELVGQCVYESPIFPPQARRLARERIEQLAMGENAAPTEYQLMRKDGILIDVEVSSILSRIGGRAVLLCSSRDLTARNEANKERQILDRQRQLALDAACLGWWHYVPETKVASHDQRSVAILGLPDEACSIDDILRLVHPDDLQDVSKKFEAALNPDDPQPYHAEYRITRPDGELRWIEAHGIAVFEGEGNDRHAVDFTGTLADVTESKQLHEALEKRILALTRPLDYSEGITFDNLFERKQLQLLQDQFSRATGVASVITLPDGTPVTEPSHYTDLCEMIIHKTGNGCADCYQSATSRGSQRPPGPLVQTCLSGGLWDAAARIEVAGQHVANWFIGQVRNEDQTDEQIISFAREVGLDEEVLLDAFHHIPVMSRERFENVVQALHTLTNQLSTSAYQNVQQARFIAAQQKAEADLKESEARYRRLFGTVSDAVIIFDGNTRRFIEVNDAAVAMYGYTRDEFLDLTQPQITAEPDKSNQSILEVLDGQVKEVPLRQHRRKDGSIFPAEISACSFKWKGQALVCGVIRDISERVEREEEIQKNRTELRRLASELTLAEQRERQRVASELHDGISQLLSSAYLRLDTLRQTSFPDESAGQTLERVCEIIDQALKETRSLTFELSCPLLSELGLTASLEQLCNTMTRDHGISFKYVGEMKFIPVPPDHKFVIFRAVSELLMNVLKHSKANRAQVKMECRDGKVFVVVEDDGRGFDTSKAGLGFSPGGGFGLFSIGEYIRHTGGELEISSIPEGGTRASFFVPLEVSYG